MKWDMQIWRDFLHHPSAIARPFIDLTETLMAEDIGMFSDSSKNPKLGTGAICGKQWIMQQWDENFVLKNDPSIEYLELYGVVLAVFTWYRNL